MRYTIYCPDEGRDKSKDKLLRKPSLTPQSLTGLAKIFFGLRDFYGELRGEIRVGENEQFFTVFNDFLECSKSRWTMRPFELELLDRMIKRAKMNSKPQVREVLAGILSKRNTTVNVKAQVEFLETYLKLFPRSESSELESAFNAVISAVVLFFVYQYLIGYVDRGGSKNYSSGSLDFRDTYVSIVLFQGAYVWIKFRDVAPKRSVYRRPKKDKISGNVIGYGKWEPKFKPPREKNVVTGKSQQFDHLSLGAYDTHEEAEIVCQIAGFYYGKDDGQVALQDGSHFSIPPMSDQERGLSGKEKANRVSARAKEVYEDFKKEKAARSLPNVAHDASAHSDWCSTLQEIVSGEVDMPAEDDEFNLRIASQHERHIQHQQQLQEQILDLQLQLHSSEAYCGKWCNHFGPNSHPL